MAIKYVLSKEELDAQERGTLDATAGVVHGTDTGTQAEDKNTSSLYDLTSGNSTNKNSLLSQINLNGKSFSEYYKSGGYIPTGYRETARALSIEEDRKAEYAKVESGEIGYQDFLMKAYGKDILKSQSIDLSNPLYWYNRVKSGDFSSPLDNDYTYMSILETAETAFKKETWYEQISTTDISDTLLAPLAEAQLGKKIDGETFKTLFPEMTQAMSQAFDDDIDKMLTYYQAGYLNGVFKPYIDTNGDGEYDYVLHTDGKLYKATEDNASRGEIQINYKKDSAGRYVIDDNGNRLVDSFETRGWFGTSDVGQWFNTFTSGAITAFTSLVDIFGLAYSGLMGMFDVNKTFGDYYAEYEALKSTSVWRNLENTDTIIYDQGEESSAQKWAAATGTVLSIAGQAIITFYTGGGYAALKAGAEAGKLTTKAVAKTAATVIGKTLVMTGVGALAGAGISAALGGDVQTGATVGASIGAIAGFGGGLRGVSKLTKALTQNIDDVAKVGAKVATKSVASKVASGAGNVLSKTVDAVSKAAKETFQFLWRLSTRMRSGQPFIASATSMTRWAVWSRSIESALMLSVKDGLETFARVQSGGRIQGALYGTTDGKAGIAYDEDYWTRQAFTKAAVVTVASFGVSTLLRAGQNTTASSRFAVIKAKSNPAFQHQLLSMSKRIGWEILDSSLDIVENYLTAAISSWGNDATSRTGEGTFGADIWRHTLNTVKSPTMALMSAYISANNHGVFSKITGNTSLNTDLYSAVYRNSVSFQRDTIDLSDSAMSRMLDTCTPEQREAVEAEFKKFAEIKADVLKEWDSENPGEVLDEATLNLKVLDAYAKRLDDITGGEVPKAFNDAFKAELDERIKNKQGDIKLYKAMKKAFSKTVKNPIDAITKVYFKTNYTKFKKEEYKKLMLQIQEDYKAYDTYIKNGFKLAGKNILETMEGFSDEQIAEAKNEKRVAKMFNKLNNPLLNMLSPLVKDILLKTGEKLKASDGEAYKKYVDNWLGENGGLLEDLPELLRTALKQSTADMARYYMPDIRRIVDEDVAKFMEDGEYFNLGSLQGEVVTKKVLNSDGEEEEMLVYDQGVEAKQILLNKDNVKKLVEKGIIQQDEDGNPISVLHQSAYLKFNQAKRNELLKNPKYVNIIKFFDTMAEFFDKGVLDYDYPLIMKLKGSYKNSEGENTDQDIYIIPNFDIINFTKNMSLIPALLQTLMVSAHSKELSKVNDAFTILGLMKQQETATFNMDDLTDETKASAKRAGLATFLYFFNIAESEDKDLSNHNLVSRTRLLELFNIGAFSREDLDALAKDVNNTKSELSALDTRLKNNIEQLKVYLDLISEGDQMVKTIKASKENEDRKLTTKEIEDIKAYVIKCKETNKEVYDALVKDGILSKEFDDFIQGININKSFQGEQDNTGEVVIKTSKVLSKRLQQNDINISDTELKPLVEHLYNSFLSDGETFYKPLTFKNDMTADEVSYQLRATKDSFSTDVNKKHINSIKNNSTKNAMKKYLGLALDNPDVLKTDNPEYITIKTKLDEAIATGILTESKAKSFLTAVNNAAKGHVNMYAAFIKNLFKQGKNYDYQEMFNLYKGLPGAVDMTLKEFKDEARKNNSEVFTTMYKHLKKKRILDFTQAQGKLSETQLLHLATEALNIKYGKGTIDVNPTNVVTIDLTEFTSKGFNDALKAIAIEARRSSAFKKENFDDEIKRSLKGLTPYHQRLIAKHLAEGKTTLSFNLNIDSERKEFDDFIKRTGYDDDASIYKPEIAGVSYNDTVERGIEISMSKEIDGRKLSPSEILKHIQENIKVEYIDSSKKDNRINYTTRLDCLARDVVYIDDDTVLRNIEGNKVLTLAPTGTLSPTTPGESIHTTKLEVKQGVSAGHLASSIQELFDTYHVAGDSRDNNLLDSLRTYGVIEAVAEYFNPDGDYNDVQITQRFNTQEAYDEALSVLKDSPLYKVTESKDTMTLIITSKGLSEKDFIVEAVAMLENDAEIDLRKILPYFVYDTMENEYRALSKGGQEFKTLGEGGNAFTPATAVMSRCNLQLKELETLLRNKVNNVYSLTDPTYKNDLTVKELINTLSNKEGKRNAFEQALLYILKAGKAIGEIHMKNNNLSTNNEVKRVLGDLSLRTYISKLFEKHYDNKNNTVDLDAVYKDLQREQNYTVYTPTQSDTEIHLDETVGTSTLRGLGADSGMKPSKISRSTLDEIYSLLQTRIIHNPDQVINGAIKDNPLLNAYSAIKLIDGKFIVKLSDLYKLDDEALQELRNLGIEIKKTVLSDEKDSLEATRNTYAGLSVGEDFKEIKLRIGLENAASASYTTEGFTAIESSLAQLAINRLKKPSTKIYDKASTILQHVEGSQLENFFRGYLSRIDDTVMKSATNYASHKVFNFANEQAFAEFIHGIKLGADLLQSYTYTRKIGDSGEVEEVKVSIPQEDAYKIAEAIMLYTNGTDYSSEFFNTFIYNRDTHEVTPFSQHYGGDLHYGKRILSSEELFKEDNNLVMIRVSKNALTSLDDPNNTIILRDLNDPTIRNTLLEEAVTLGLAEIYKRYENNREVQDMSLQNKLAFIYGQVLTRKDIYDNFTESLKIRFGGIDNIPEGILDVIYPTINNIQIGAEGLNLSEEAFLNTLHEYSIGTPTNKSKTQLQEINDVALYGITYSKLPNDVRNKLDEIKSKVLKKSSHEYKFVKAYRENNDDVMTMHLQLLLKDKTPEQKAELVQSLVYTLMLDRVSGKDLNAMFMNGKTIEKILSKDRDLSEFDKLELKYSEAFEEKDKDNTYTLDLNKAMTDDYIATDTEGMFYKSDSKDNNFKGTLPSEVSFILGKKADGNIVDRAKKGKRVTFYIKYDNINSVEIAGNKKTDELADNVLYYKNEDAYNKYINIISKADVTTGPKIISNDGKDIVIVIKGDKENLTNNKLKQVILGSLSGTEYSEINTVMKELFSEILNSSTRNVIAYNGKQYDDYIFEKLGLSDMFKTTVDGFELLKKVYSTLTDGETETSLDYLVKKKELVKNYKLEDEYAAHSASYDTLVQLALLQEFYNNIQDANTYRNALSKDILSIGSKVFRESDMDKVKDLLSPIKNNTFDTDMTEIKKLDKIVDYQKYGDNLSNTILKQIQNAYHSLLNAQTLASASARVISILNTLTGDDLTFIYRMNDPVHRKNQVTFINKVLANVLELTGANKIDMNVLPVAAKVIQKIIEAQINKEESFKVAAERFFSLSPEDQEDIVIKAITENPESFIIKGQYVNAEWDKESTINKQAFIDIFSKFKETVKHDFDKDESKLIESLFANDYNSYVETIRRAADVSSLRHILANNLNPLWDEMFGKDSIFKGTPDNVKSKVQDLLTTWYGQTEDQTKEGFKNPKLIMESIFNHYLYGDKGYENTSSLGNQIMSSWMERIRTFRSYDKIIGLPDSRYDDGTIYMSTAEFTKLFNVTPDEAKQVYGDEDIFVEAQRHPSFKQDVIHTIKVVVDDTIKVPLGMTLNTAQHLHMGDTDGDGLCLSLNKDTVSYGRSIYKHTNTALGMLNLITKIDGFDKIKVGEFNVNEYNKVLDDVNIEARKHLYDIYAVAANPKVDTDTKRLKISTLKNIIKERFERFGGDLNFDMFWKFYGVHEFDTRETGLAEEPIQYYSHSNIIRQDNILAKNLTKSKQLSSQYYDVLKIRDQAGYLQKQAIKQGETINTSTKTHPFIYTPLNIPGETYARINKAFEDKALRAEITSKLIDYISDVSTKYTGTEFESRIKDALTFIKDNKEAEDIPGSTIVATTIQLVQDAINTSDTYKQDVIKAFEDTKITDDVRKEELDNYKKLIKYAEGRGITVENTYDENSSIFEIRNAFNTLLSETLDTDKAFRAYTDLYEGSNNDSMLQLMFNLAMNRYSETEDKNILYCDNIGDTSMVRNSTKNKTYVNAVNMKVKLSEEIPSDTIVITNRGSKIRTSNVASYKLPEGYKVTKEVINAYKTGDSMLTTAIHNGIKPEASSPYKIILLMDKDGKALDKNDTIDINKVAMVVTSERRSIADTDNGLSTTKLAIPGSGMGKGMATSSLESYGLNPDDYTDCDLVINPNMLKATKYNPTTGIINKNTFKNPDGTLQIPFTVVESTHSWSKDLKDKHTDAVTITNGIGTSEGMLRLGKYTFEVKDGELIFSTKEMADLAKLQEKAHAKDYNTTNAARVYMFLKLNSVVDYIPDNVWKEALPKEQFLINVLNSSMCGADEHTGYLTNYLIKKYLPKEKEEAFMKAMESSKIGRVLWSEETLNNFGVTYTKGIEPTNTKGFIKKKRGSLEAENKTSVFAKVNGDFPQGLEQQAGGYHDNTIGYYDTLSFMNDLLSAIGKEQLTKGNAVLATKNNLVRTARQVKGSMVNGFNSIDIEDAVNVPYSKFTNRGTTKTDFPTSQTPQLRVLNSRDTILTDEEAMTMSRSNELSNNKDITADIKYNASEYKDLKESVRDKQTLGYMLGILRPSSNIEQTARNFNNQYPNVRVNTSPKMIVMNNGEMRVVMAPNNEEVEFGNVRSTLYKRVAPSDYYETRDARTKALLKNIQDNKDINNVKTNVKSENDYFKEVFANIKSPEGLINKQAFSESTVAKTLSEAYSKLCSGECEFISKETSNHFKALFDLEIPEGQELKKAWLSSSGLKGSYAVDRLMTSIYPTQRAFVNQLKGSELDSLIYIFKQSGYERAYQDFNKYIYTELYYAKYLRALEGVNKGSVVSDIHKKSLEACEQFFKTNYPEEFKNGGYDGIKKSLEFYKSSHADILNGVNAIINRIGIVKNNLDIADGKLPEGAYSLLIDEVVKRNKAEASKTSMELPEELNILDVIKDGDILNTLSKEINSLATRAAYKNFIEKLKEEKRMSNLPILSKIEQLSKEVLDNLEKMKVSTFNEAYYDKETSLISALISSARDLGYVISDAEIKGALGMTDRHGLALRVLYEKVYSDIHSEGFLPYSELVKRYTNDPTNQEVITALNKHQLLSSILGSITYTTKHSENSSNKTYVTKYLTTEIYNKFMETFDKSKYSLVDGNGRPFFMVDKKGNEHFTYDEKSYMPFISIDDMVIHIAKYNKDANMSDDDIKFNIVTAMMNGDAYIMEKALADTYAETYHHIFANQSSVAFNKLKKVVQASRKLFSALLMCNPIRFIDRMFNQYAFDYGTLIKNDFKFLKYVPQAKKELNQFKASKGSVVSEPLKMFIAATGYQPDDLAVAGENIKTYGNAYTRLINEGFNTQHFESRYTAFLSLYEAALKNNGNIPAHLAGSAYYKLKDINGYNPTNKMMSTEESFQYNTAVKCMAVISEALGTNGDMPYLSHKLGDVGMMFTSFPLAAMRGGVGKLKSLGYAIYDSFVNKSDASASRKYLMQQLGGMLAVTGAHMLIALLLSPELQDAVSEFLLEDDEDKDEKEKNEDKLAFWQAMNKYFFSGATLQPFQSLMNGEPVFSEYQNRDVGAALYNMFAEPFVTSQIDGDPETNIGTATWRTLMDNVWSHVNPLFKDPAESIPGNTALQSLPNVYNSDSTFFENFFRKLGSYTIGYSATNELFDSYKADTYSDKSFIEKVSDGATRALQTSLGNNKIDKNNWKTYTNAKSIIYNFNKLYGESYYSNDYFDKESYSEISNTLNAALKTGKSPETIYNIIQEYLDQGIQVKVIRSAVRNCSLAYKISQVDQDKLIESLTEKELNILKQALAYEKVMFPFLQEAIDKVDDIYEESYKDSYYDSPEYEYNQAMYNLQDILYNYKAYNYSKDYNNRYYNNYYKQYSTYNRYNTSQYETPMDVFKKLEQDRAYQQRQNEYARQRKEWYN